MCVLSSAWPQLCWDLGQSWFQFTFPMTVVVMFTLGGSHVLHLHLSHSPGPLDCYSWALNKKVVGVVAQAHV